MGWRFRVAAGALFLAYLPALREIYFSGRLGLALCALEWAKDPSTLWTLDPSYSFRPLCRLVPCVYRSSRTRRPATCPCSCSFIF